MHSGLGQLEGPLLLFGGAYSNFEATRSLRLVAGRLGIGPGNVICTGDTVAYCGRPNQTVDCLRDWGVHVVMGNCEESLGWGSEDCGCGFEKGSACDALASGWYGFARRTLSEDHRCWMRGLPRSIGFRYAGKRFSVVHGGADNINQFIFPSTDPSLKLRQMKHAGVDGTVAGHCGLPFTQQFGEHLWHNPGAIGLPANDGTPRVWYALWMPENGVIRIEHRAMHYDARREHSAMLDGGLDAGYAEALLSGVWPSMDVLPDAERGQRGRRLEERVVRFPAVRN